MGVFSMTGFARTEGEADGISWAWELKSVNSRALDLRLRLPLGFDGLEPALRASLARFCRRGNVSASLSVNRTVPPTIRINREMLAQVIALARDVAAQVEAAPPRVRRPDRSPRDHRDGRARSRTGRRGPAHRHDGGLGVGAAPVGGDARRGGGAAVRDVVVAAIGAYDAGRISDWLRRSAKSSNPSALRRAACGTCRAGADNAPRAGRPGIGDAGHPR